MSTKLLEKLEFDQITATLSQYAITEWGKKACLSLVPLFQKESTRFLLQETTEATIFSLRKGNPPLDSMPPIQTHLKILIGEGTLSCQQLLDLTHILTMARELKQYATNADVDLSDLTILSSYFDALYTNASVEQAVLKSIVSEEHVEDHASEELYRIRSQMRSIEETIRTQLASFLNKKQIQEPIITIRNHRFVIPVKQEYRSEIKGLVHDVSASGSTVFIEPISVFELNNELASLQVKEKAEIEKILKHLSSLFYPMTEALSNDVTSIGQIDFAFAKAHYGQHIHATEPLLLDAPQIILKQARHPLLDPQKVVPIDFEIGHNYSSLVITGPNTGGKTVTLKTVGLLTIMAICGLYIPAKESSGIYVFDQVFADIGDLQSIAESLSTFSAHMTNIIQIVKKATANSLILVDELGAGTDPIEGSCLAVSLLEYWHQKHALTLATTHYPEVKNYALTHPGFENASCEFDIQTLSPTYHLLIGVPGKSMAFAISQKLGLPVSILDNAKSRLSQESTNVEDLIQNIYQQKAQMENEKKLTDQLLAEAQNLKGNLQTEQQQWQEKKEEILAKAKLEAHQLLLQTQEETDAIRKQLSASSSAELSHVKAKLHTEMKKLYTPTASSKIPTLDPNQLKIGMDVTISSLHQTGILRSLPNKENLVQVQIGSMKMNVKLSDLAIAPSSKKQKQTISSSYTTSKSKHFSSEINVIGYTVDDAVYLLDKYMDDAILAHVHEIRIVHGKGTGTLRKGIHQYLKKNPRVRSFRLGGIGEGDTGVTIVEL